MLNWFDLMRQAQAAPALAALTRQYGLSNEQMQKAMAAFLPAFAMGVQRGSGPADPGRLMQTMMSQAYLNFWQTAGQTFSSQMDKEGRKVLDQLFGSDEVTRRVAHQAADYAGISVDTMRQVLPVLAGIAAGGFYQWMMAQGAQGPQRAPEPQTPEREVNPFLDMWRAWTPSPTPAPTPAPAATPAAEGRPARDPFQAMVAAFLGRPSVAPTEKPDQVQPAPGSVPRTGAPPLATPEDSAKETSMTGDTSAQPATPPASRPWEEMVEQGREMQKEYLASLQAIFETAPEAGNPAPATSGSESADDGTKGVSARAGRTNSRRTKASGLKSAPSKPTGPKGAKPRTR